MGWVVRLCRTGVVVDKRSRVQRPRGDMKMDQVVTVCKESVVNNDFDGRSGYREELRFLRRASSPSRAGLAL